MPASSEKKPSSRRDGAEPPRRRRAERPATDVPRQRRFVNALLLFAAVVLLVDALVGDKGLVERMRAGRQLRDAEASLAALKAENAQNREYIVRLSDDPSTIEALAREELGLIRPGELLFIVRDAQPPASN
jgi:cell division protein FtsB